MKRQQFQAVMAQKKGDSGRVGEAGEYVAAFEGWWE